jgi:hypothetical protein
MNSDADNDPLKCNKLDGNLRVPKETSPTVCSGRYLRRKIGNKQRIAQMNASNNVITPLAWYVTANTPILIYPVDERNTFTFRTLLLLLQQLELKELPAG